MRSGRLTMDEPTELPEGLVVDLVIDDEGDDMGPAERAALDRALSRSLRDEAAGRTAPADVLLERLRARRAR